MKTVTFYAAGTSAASRYACQILRQHYRISNKPEADVTHLLLPVPSFEADGRIRGGGVLEHILSDLPENITVIGGNLNHPGLRGYHTVDLMRDGEYVARNAAITADCAIRVAGEKLPVIFEGCPVLIIGWGRIGKCLAATLKALGAAVTVTSRKAEDRNILKALGYGAADPAMAAKIAGKYRIIFNTAPVTVLPEGPKDALKIDLASQRGIGGSDVIWARGLPGKRAPESSGALVAQTVCRLLGEKEAKA